MKIERITLMKIERIRIVVPVADLVHVPGAIARLAALDFPHAETLDPRDLRLRPEGRSTSGGRRHGDGGGLGLLEIQVANATLVPAADQAALDAVSLSTQRLLAKARSISTEAPSKTNI